MNLDQIFDGLELNSKAIALPQRDTKREKFRRKKLGLQNTLNNEKPGNLRSISSFYLQHSQLLPTIAGNRDSTVLPQLP